MYRERPVQWELLAGLSNCIILESKILGPSAPYDGPSQSGVGTGDRCVEIPVAGGGSQFDEVTPLSPKQL
jgi:hypothetical protein